MNGEGIVFHKYPHVDKTNRTYHAVTVSIGEEAGLGEVLQAFRYFALACGWDKEQWEKCLRDDLDGKEPVG